MTTLYIIGDSFTHSINSHRPERPAWMHELATRLNCNKTVNLSHAGVAQDYCWSVLQSWSELIQPEDYLVVVLTHPSRYWYVEDQPDLSNSFIIGLDQHTGPDMARAIELYIRHIQRPQLDTVQMISRLGWLGYLTLNKGLRRPLVIKGFLMELYEAEQYTALNYAKGVLTAVQNQEFKVKDISSEVLFYGTDFRYNHLSLRNHAIMAEKVAHALVTDTELDLTTGFHHSFIDEEFIADLVVCDQEFNPIFIEHSRKMREENKNKHITSWLKGFRK